MIRVFIDESGNMGSEGEYFVLAALVVKTDKAEARLKRMVRREQLRDAKGGRLELAKKRELKFSKMKFPQRQRIIEKIARERDVEESPWAPQRPGE